MLDHIKWWNSFNPDAAYVKGRYLYNVIEFYFPRKTMCNITDSEIWVMWIWETSWRLNHKELQ